jgi:hypothetical protein
MTTTSTRDKPTADLAVWFAGAVDKLPAEAFTLTQAVKVEDPLLFYSCLLRDVDAGPVAPRASVVATDLENLRLKFGPKRRDWQRPTSRERGYRSDWEKLREKHVLANPFCFDCLQDGVETPVAEVDHRPPLSGADDPGRLDPARLVSRCRRHHALQTAHDKKLGLTAPWKQAGAA